MKKLLILGTVLALLAVLAIPMAAFADTTGTTNVDGNMVATTISVLAPDACNFSNFTQGNNGPAAGGNQGNVTFTQGSATYDHWQLKIYSTGSYSSGQMWGGPGRFLDNHIWINIDNNYGTSFNPADPGMTFNEDSTASFNYWIYAWQTITPNDATAGAGAYTIVITSEVSLIP